MAKQDSTVPGRPPDPTELHLAAVYARDAAEAFARAVAAARTAGVVVDDEVFECSATVTSWATWLGAYARQADREDTT
jgi:hypothetical protein